MVRSRKAQLDIVRTSLPAIRKGNQWSVRRWARELHVTVPDIHEVANCAQQRECKGSGCHIR
jgi:hypothetical protein